MKNEEQTINTPLVNEVPENEYYSATSEWKGARLAQNEMLGSIILPEYFDIPYDDLMSLLLEALAGSKKVRAHIGVTHYGEYNGHVNTSEMRLYLTGVDANGNSIKSIDGKSKIYDFVTPCPPTCKK